MKCAWEALLSILPQWMRQDTDKLGREKLQEIRLRSGQPPVLIMDGETVSLDRKTEDKDIAFSINAATGYSPWAAESVAKGYISCQGGHRIGLCGEAVIRNGTLSGMKNIRSLCIRVARDLPGCSNKIEEIQKSWLIIGPPGSGKTTLLRDLIRRVSSTKAGSIAVVDERGELFPPGAFDEGPGTDILTGCGKAQGLDILVRTMGPGYIAMDEITAEEDCEALVRAGNCGVKLLATVHGTSLDDLKGRPIFRDLLKMNLFDGYVILHQDKSLRTERMGMQ